jgi:hypothetical protein
MTGVMRVTTLLAAIATGALLGALPAGADNISIGVSIGTPPPPPPVVVTAPPQLVVVPGTPVYYAPNVSFNYFRYGGSYFSHHGGVWFVANAHNGPWVSVGIASVPKAVLAVPVAYYKIPPGHAKKLGHRGGGLGKGHKHKKKDD